MGMKELNYHLMGNCFVYSYCGANKTVGAHDCVDRTIIYAVDGQNFVWHRNAVKPLPTHLQRFYLATGSQRLTQDALCDHQR